MSENVQEISSQTSDISKFYAGKIIFLTGAAGFLGSVLLEILLRCCPDIYRIYILLRPKKGVQVEDRKNLIFKKDIFSILNTTNPDVLNKVVAVSGDTSQENLGLSEDDFNMLIKEVSVVFHAAATLSFTKPLSFTVRQNVIGTNYVIDFCRKAEKLEVLVYTSSAFSNSNQKDVIEEKIYDLPFSSEEIIKFGRYDNDDELMKLFHMCQPPFPNFYTFSKCVAENMLKEKASDLPVCIIRPSIIVSCLKGPLPGYVEDGAAMAYLNIGVGKGFFRVLLLDKHKRLEIIPVDVAASSHIVGAFQHISKSLPSPSVFNCVTGELADFRWAVFIQKMLQNARRRPLPQTILCPFTICFKNRTLYRIFSFLLHYIPAVIIDLLLWIAGIDFRLQKLCKIYDTSMKTVEFFTMREWDMKNKNFQALSKGLSSLDKEIFPTDLQGITLDKLMGSLSTGAVAYRINGKPFKESIQWACLRYFLTFLFICFYVGSLSSILYLVYSKVW